jgi:hypothetical protein
MVLPVDAVLVPLRPREFRSAAPSGKRHRERRAAIDFVTVALLCSA